ncbi:MAG: hypothetical protein ACOY30_07450 [Bacillota bacterium]
MKKIIILILSAVVLLTAAPAFSAPSENAGIQAFEAQAVKICREMMKNAVDTGNMTKDQLKACINMMKTAPCNGMVLE